MKQKTIFLSALMLLFGLINVFAVIQTTVNQDEKEEIRLSEEGKMPHSITFTQVEAYHDGSVIELYVDNYVGPVTMHIKGSSLYITVDVNGSGFATMDISQLPGGVHTLQVTTESSVLVGDFEL